MGGARISAVHGRAKITYAELEERFGTSLTPENGFCKLLAEELKQRKEFSFVAFYNDELSERRHLHAQRHRRGERQQAVL